MASLTIEQNQYNKQLVWDFWQSLEAPDAEDLNSETRHFTGEECTWYGHDPIDQMVGADAFISEYWRPLLRSFPDLQRQTHVFCGGASSGTIDGTKDGHAWVGGTGLFHATFANDYLSIPAHQEKVSIRWGEFCRIENKQIVESYFLLDLVDLMQQAGYYVLPPSRGADGIYPPPIANDGILLDAQDEGISSRTLQYIRRFCFEALNSYDQSNLKSMGIADYFHPDVKWYGPGGIGACLSLREFEKHHQQPWLAAYPDRQVQDLTALIAEGDYCGGPGWAGVKATHAGNYLDAPATNRPIEFNGIDFWKLENGTYVENWVFVDMIHLFRQFGIDLFGRLEKLVKNGTYTKN